MLFINAFTIRWLAAAIQHADHCRNMAAVFHDTRMHRTRLPSTIGWRHVTIEWLHACVAFDERFQTSRSSTPRVSRHRLAGIVNGGCQRLENAPTRTSISINPAERARLSVCCSFESHGFLVPAHCTPPAPPPRDPPNKHPHPASDASQLVPGMKRAGHALELTTSRSVWPALPFSLQLPLA